MLSNVNSLLFLSKQKFQGVDSIWVNVQKDSVSNAWNVKGSIPLTEFQSDWDVNEPASALGANCVTMTKSSGY
jgi:hypothetical protein